MFRHKVDVVLMSFDGRCYVNVSVRPIAVIDKHAGHVLQIIAMKKRLFHKRALENY